MKTTAASGLRTRPPVIDADRHLQETWRIFRDHCEPAYRGRVYRRVELEGGRHGLALGDRLLPFSAALWEDPHANQMFPDGRFAPNDPRADALEPDGYVAAMDAEGIDVALLSPTLAMGNYSIPDGEIGSALCRAYGRWVAEFADGRRDRLLPLYPVNLFDVEQTCRDLLWATDELRIAGVQVISLPVGQQGLHEDVFEPFWRTVEDLGLVVQMHSLSSLPDAEGRGPLTDIVAGVARFGGNLCLHHLVSHRLEQHLAMASLVMGGVLARHPGLRVIFVEAGAGWVASWLEEMDSHYQAEPMRRWVPCLEMSPGEYFRRQCLAAFQADEVSIAAIAPVLGFDHVAWSSDYPHHDGVYPGAVDSVVRQLADRTDGERAALLGGNVARFCNLP